MAVTPVGGRQIHAFETTRVLFIWTGFMGIVRGANFQTSLAKSQWKNRCSVVSRSPRLSRFSPRGKAFCTMFQRNTFIFGDILTVQISDIQFVACWFWGWSRLSFISLPFSPSIRLSWLGAKCRRLQLLSCLVSELESQLGKTVILSSSLQYSILC